MMHGGAIGAVVALGASGLVYLVADEMEERGISIALPRLASRKPEEGAGDGGNKRGFLYRALTPKNMREEDEWEEEENKDPRFTRPSAANTGGIERLTIEEIVAHTRPNSFTIWIGRSLTQDGNPAIQINFYKQHFRFIGASQRGKSSMVAAFLEIVTRTHDPKHVQLILLDKENLTSNLFSDVPHVVKMRLQSGEVVKMHARSNEQVLRYLIQTVVIMEKRYQVIEREGIAALKKMPVILVYIEEFLRLKAYYKAQLKTGSDKEQAESDYATLMYCINELAGRGLKARVQLLLCAQVEYADDDFREAMANISCGFSFCVKRDAAMAAGFTNAELLTRNKKENKVGQAVVECPDCNDLVLAPEYDLEARLEAWQEENEGLDDEPETEHLETSPLQLQPGGQAERPAPQQEQNQQERNQRKLTTLHRQALEHWQPGISYRDLGEKISVGKDKAGELIKELKKWGFLKDDGSDE